MSTRCRIGIQNQDGTITSVYCHHDGYLEHVGNILVKHYTDESKIRKLMELGDMSSLGTEPIDNPNAWADCFSFNVFKLGVDMFERYKEMHPENMCDTYKSRGEDCPASVSKNITEYRKLSKDCWGEYTYLFKDNKWYHIESGRSYIVKAK